MNRRYLKNKAKIENKTNLSFGERSTRIVLLITLFGALGYIAKTLLKIYISIFSEKIYLDFPFSAEHIIIVLIISYFFIIFIKILQYLYYELYSFSFYFGKNSNINHQIKTVEQANKYYYYIFLACKEVAIYSIVIGFITIGILNIYLKNIIVIAILIILLLIIILLISLKREKFSEIFRIKKLFNSTLGLLIGISFFSFFIGVHFYIQPVNLEVAFETQGEEELLVINSKYYLPSSANIIFLSEDENGEYILSKSIILEDKDFINTFIEVKQSEVSSNNKFLKVIDNLTKKSKEVYVIKDTDIKYTYKLNYESYLIEGNNKVVINLDIEEGILNKSFKIVNHINVKNDEYDIFERHFSVGE
ncbi:hypothetical protein [Ureibacillus sp. FSL W8-0352]|uniref:hypothetical protein n=1 Tax=Ureibacillus sp. FSL W8-0352 TaxID=2954596 RepID=UPI0030FA48B7